MILMEEVERPFLLLSGNATVTLISTLARLDVCATHLLELVSTNRFNTVEHNSRT
jgi:hypothetical protein